MARVAYLAQHADPPRLSAAAARLVPTPCSGASSIPPSPANVRPQAVAPVTAPPSWGGVAEEAPAEEKPAAGTESTAGEEPEPCRAAAAQAATSQPPRRVLAAFAPAEALQSEAPSKPALEPPRQASAAKPGSAPAEVHAAPQAGPPVPERLPSPAPQRAPMSAAARAGRIAPGSKIMEMMKKFEAWRLPRQPRFLEFGPLRLSVHMPPPLETAQAEVYVQPMI